MIYRKYAIIRISLNQLLMEDNKQDKLFVELDRDTFLKLVKLNKPNEIQFDWLKSLVEHACVCEKWREEQV